MSDIFRMPNSTSPDILDSFSIENYVVEKIQNVVSLDLEIKHIRKKLNDLTTQRNDLVASEIQYLKDKLGLNMLSKKAKALSKMANKELLNIGEKDIDRLNPKLSKKPINADKSTSEDLNEQD